MLCSEALVLTALAGRMLSCRPRVGPSLCPKIPEHQMALTGHLTYEQCCVKGLRYFWVFVSLPSLMQPRRLLGCFATRAYCWLWSTWCPSGSQGPFLQSCSPAGQPQTALVPEVIPPQGQDMAFPCVELHEVSVGPLLQPVKVLMSGITTSWPISHSCSSIQSS